MNPKRKINVLVVDDSALMRKMIPMILTADSDIEVAGTAMDGEFALKKIPELRPDVITLDIDMPRMDGLTALKSIMRDFKIPVILVSSLTKEGAEVTLRGLEMGAFDFVPKPNEAISLHISDIAHELIGKIKAAYRARPVRFKEPRTMKIKPERIPARASSFENIVTIGVSTGGPQALTEILPEVPPGFPAPILIVQHMPEGFTELFANRLDAICGIRVKEAESGDVITPGMAFIAPGGKHLKVKRTAFGAIAVISHSSAVSGHRPSATLLFKAVSEEFGNKTVGIIMTGMGDDGVEGMRMIKEKGGITIAQDEDTSVIYGMPKVAVEKGYVDMVLRLEEIVPNLITLLNIKNRNNHCKHETAVIE